MTPTEQRGYDEQIGGKIDADLYCADSKAAEQYRNGVRAARREQQGFTSAKDVADGTQYVVDTITYIKKSDAPPPTINPIIIGNPIPNAVFSGPGGAFTETSKPKKSKPSKKKDEGQLGLL